MNYPTQAIFREAAFIGKSLREIPANGGDARRNLKALGQKPSDVFMEAARGVLEGYDIAEDDIPWMTTDTAYVIQNNALSWLNGPILLVRGGSVFLPKDAVAARTKLLESPLASVLHIQGDGRRVTSDLFRDLDSFVQRVSVKPSTFTYGIRVRNVFSAPGELKTSLTGPVVALARHRAPAMFALGNGSVTVQPATPLADLLDTGPGSYGNHSKPRPKPEEWDYRWVDFVR